MRGATVVAAVGFVAADLPTLGHIEDPQAIEQLDALRWLAWVSRHSWRIAHHSEPQRRLASVDVSEAAEEELD